MNKKPLLLIPIQWYHPGFRAGGIIQAVKRLAGALAKDYRIFILTTNYDLNSKKPYPNIQTDIWQLTKDNIHVKYLSKSNTTCRTIAREIKELQPDLVYLKSMFDPRFSLFPLWLKFRGSTKASFIMASSGMLKESALAWKSWKKKPVLFLIRNSHFYKKIHWQATDKQEQEDIKRQIGEDAPIWLLPEFPPPLTTNIITLEKKDPLKLLYLSRIHPIKNLSFLLDVLLEVKVPVQLSIGGPIEDNAYMLSCQKRINTLPASITVTQIGEVPQLQVKELFEQHHAFVLPSKGEGFGNVILEALSNACPVIISDQTPWKDLNSEGAGWVIPLGKKTAFIEAIESLYKMTPSEYDALRMAAYAYAKKTSDLNNLALGYKALFGSS